MIHIRFTRRDMGATRRRDQHRLWWCPPCTRPRHRPFKQKGAPVCEPPFTPTDRPLQNELRQIGVLRQPIQLRPHIGGIDGDHLSALLRRGEADFLQEAFHHSV